MTAVSREKLYEEVWAEPMTTVAKRYDVSSNYLARICERLSVPRPPRGYWAQRAAGRGPSVEPLPEPDPGDELAWDRSVEAYALRPPPPAFAPITTRKTRRPERPKTHPILVAVREDFEDSKPKRFWDDGYLKPKAHALPDIRVSSDTLASALKVANLLYLVLEDQGYWVRLSPSTVRFHRRTVDHREGFKGHFDPYDTRLWRPGQLTLVFVGGVAIGLTLFEIAEELEAVYENDTWVRAPATRAFERQKQLQPWSVQRKHLPNGRLALHAYSPYGGADWSKCWREAKPGELEALLAGIAVELERAAPHIVDLHAEHERRAEEQRRKWEAERRQVARREAERRRAEDEVQREKEVVEVISKWRMARDLRAYVTEVRALVKAADLQIIEDGKADEELKWALAYADRVDPLTSWRKDIEKALAEQAGKPCPKCGQVHGAAHGESADATPASDPAPLDASEDAPDDGVIIGRSEHTRTWGEER